MKRFFITVATVAGAALMAGLFVANLRSDADKRRVHRTSLRAACTALYVAVRTQDPKSGGEAVAVVKCEASRCDYVVTRNVPDFPSSPVPAITSTDFLPFLAQTASTPPATP